MKTITTLAAALLVTGMMSQHVLSADEDQPILLAQAGDTPAPPAPAAPAAPAAPTAQPKLRRLGGTGGGGGGFGGGGASYNSADETRRAEEDVYRQAETLARQGEEFGRQMSLNSGLQSLTLMKGDGNSSRNLVISSGDIDAKKITASEEDLSVMSRILSKAIERQGNNEERQAMGISIFASSDGARSMQIEGYGAIFLLHARIPFSGPPKPPEEQKSDDGTSSSWDEAKRELYGPKQISVPGSAKLVEYDSKRVDKLKDSLVEALKEASNMRNLKPDDLVTVVVSSDAGGKVMTVRNLGASTGNQPWGHSLTATAQPDGPHGKGTMVIRAKKSDIDAYAKGKIHADDFRKKVSIVTY